VLDLRLRRASGVRIDPFTEKDYSPMEKALTLGLNPQPPSEKYRPAREKSARSPTESGQAEGGRYRGKSLLAPPARCRRYGASPMEARDSG
jgi:hypothetical protein